MNPEEIIARFLCDIDGGIPDGTYDDDPRREWEKYQEAASEVIRALAECGWFIGPAEQSSAETKGL